MAIYDLRRLALAGLVLLAERRGPSAMISIGDLATVAAIPAGNISNLLRELTAAGAVSESSDGSLSITDEGRHELLNTEV